MAYQTAQQGRRPHRALARAIASLAVSLTLGACAETGDLLPNAKTALADDTQPAANAITQTELQKATVYWGQEFAKKPNDLNAGLSYARNLKAMGERHKALSVLQQTSVLHSNDPELAGEYGRLALDFDQVSLAAKLLEVADNPTKPDWKVISARGTVLAKQGQYKDAVPFYERALTLSQNQPSVLNNLALAYAMSGDAKKAEGLLREASGDGKGSPKIRQNLALVLGLQGKYNEAKELSAKDMPMESAASNATFMRSMVRLEPKDGPLPPPKPFATTVAKAASASPPQPFATTVAKAIEAPEMKPASIETAAPEAAWKSNVASAAAPAAPSNSSGLRGSTR